MDDAIKVVSTYSFWDIVRILVAVVVIASIIITFFKKIYLLLESYRQKRNGIENKEKSIEERVSNLEESDKQQIEKLTEIAAGVQQLGATLDIMSTDTNKKLDALDEDSKRRSIISNRSLLYRLHAEFMEKQYITLAEREMFDGVAREYLDCGGNSIFKTKIIPEVESLPIRD